MQVKTYYSNFLEATDAGGTHITLTSGQTRRVEGTSTAHARAILDMPWIQGDDELRDTTEAIATQHIVGITAA